MTDALERFDALAGAQALETLVDDLSNWYVRRSRPRFWKSSDPNAHATMHECLLVSSQLLAPYCPFVSDELYRNLAGRDESVHLTDWPASDDAAIDDELEAEMALARTLVSLGRSARSDARRGVRQPLPRAIALLHGGETLRPEVVQEIKDELNVKQFDVVSSLEGLLSYRVVPNFRALGPRLGAQARLVKELLTQVDGGEVRRALDEEGRYELAVDGSTVVLEPSDVEIRAEQHEDLSLAQDGPHAVALDLTLDDALIAEGIARELSRVINDERKAQDFALSDRITVQLQATGRVADAAKQHRDWIAGEVLATTFQVVADDVARGSETTTIAELPVKILLSRA